MGIKTKIEYADSSINPIMGCSGCKLRKDHCYAAILCARYAGRKGWPQSFDHPEFFPGRLEKAIKWKDLTGTKRPDKPWLDRYPRVVFVNDMSDGFCPGVDPVQWLLPLLGQMAVSSHIWLLLTKWPDRMVTVFGRWGVPDNVWVGTSITTQEDADWRIPWLLQIPAAVHFVSLEPLLEGVDPAEWLAVYQTGNKSWVRKKGYREAFTGHVRLAPKPQLGWVIVGGETGHGARPMKPQWARDIRDQCQAAGVPYFFKSWGQFVPEGHWGQLTTEQRNKRGAIYSFDDKPFPLNQRMYSVSKKLAGRTLDGKEYSEMPRRQA